MYLMVQEPQELSGSVPNSENEMTPFHVWKQGRSRSDFFIEEM
jgi:hypothetical protein